MATATTIKFGDGLSVVDEGGGVINVSAGGGTPADATTSSKGIVQLAGDLAGTAASPQIAAGVIVDADINTAAAIAYAKLALTGAIVNADIATAAAIAVAKLAAGTNGQVLTTVSGAPAWATPATVSYGTTLPASPVDGQEAILVDSTTNPTYQWRFRYNAGSTSAYKWELVGGSPARHEIATYESSNSTNYVDLTTVGPTLTLARAGEYEIVFGMQCDVGNTAGNGGHVTVKLGAAAAQDSDAIMLSYDSAATGQRASSSSRTIVRTAAAGDTFKLQYRAIQFITNGYYNRFLFIRPIRVS